jgi:predicted lipoprotein with Yx(FWY)xxD motif
MPQSIPRRRSSALIRTAGLAVLAIAMLAAAVATSGAAQGGTTKRVAAEAQNPELGKTILTTTKGRTLYSLSVEKNGRFICTGPCLSTWHPLTVPAGTRPIGPVKLSTISRPNGGGLQVTYKGRPLYRFAGDTKAGDVNGEGIKDVGTWHAAATPQTKAAPEAQPPAEPPPPYQPPYDY